MLTTQIYLLPIDMLKSRIVQIVLHQLRYTESTSLCISTYMVISHLHAEGKSEFTHTLREKTSQLFRIHLHPSMNEAHPIITHAIFMEPGSLHEENYLLELVARKIRKSKT